MKEQSQSDEIPEESAVPRHTFGEVRPLTSAQRTTLVILSFYMAIFCICTFMYWHGVALKALGIASATAGLVLFIAAFFNTEAPEESNSIHPLRSCTFSLVISLLVLFSIRFLGGFISNTVLAMAVLYGGLAGALIVFRRALVQMVSLLLAVVFLFVTFVNRHDVLVGHMTFKDAVRQCGQVVFRIGPIEDVANLLIYSNYMGYLSRIDYRDKQINILATRTVAGCEDDDLRKTVALLGFVSNKIHYVSDPEDGAEYAKEPITTLIAGGGDCEDQALLLCSMLETVGVKTYIAFTDEHVFALVGFDQSYAGLAAVPHVYIDGNPCYALDPADPGAVIGYSTAAPHEVKRVFDVRGKAPLHFTLHPDAGRSI
jgi:hypothetical protein